MNVKVEEAKTKKICIYLLVANQPFNCLGPDCMMWRWDEDSRTKVTGPPTDRIREATDKDTWKGYCGLAGRPEVER